MKFHFFPDRERVWNSKGKLHNTGYILKEDFPLEIQKARSVLLPVLRCAKYNGAKVRLNKDKIVIDGKSYGTTDLPKEYSPRNISERRITTEDKDYILFAGEGSPLSNFHETNFKIDGRTFTSTEQYFGYIKALSARDQEKARLIMKTTNVRRIKSLSNKLKTNPESWSDSHATETMKKGLFAKFTQNTSLKDTLLKTGDAVLVECTKNTTWGNGCFLFSRETDDISKWKGTNLLGNLLSELRQRLRQT